MPRSIRRRFRCSPSSPSTLRSKPADLTGQTEVHATLHGPLKNKKLLEAHVTIPTLKLAYSNTIQLAETSPIQVDYKDTVITLQRSGLKGTDTDLQFQGSMSTTKGAPMSLLLLGTVNLHLAQVFAPGHQELGRVEVQYQFEWSDRTAPT